MLDLPERVDVLPLDFPAAAVGAALVGAAAERTEMAEVVIVDTVDEAGELAADRIAALVDPQARRGARARHRIHPAPGVGGPSRRGASTGHACAASPSTSTSACRPAIRRSYRAVITREVVEPLGLDPALVRVPGDDDGPLDTAGERYEAAIRDAGGVDLQILGIGRTGHIGFNEPGSSLASRTRVKTLTDATRTDNARFFDRPRRRAAALPDAGARHDPRARGLVLLAFGEAKADAVAGAVEGPVSASLPGSVIQLHPDVTVLIDEAAASRLRYADYYRSAWNNRLDL